MATTEALAQAPPQLDDYARAALQEDLGAVTIALPEGEDEKVSLAPDDLAFLDRMMYKRKALLAQMEVNTLIAERRKADVEQWLGQVNSTLLSQVQYLTGVLLQVARHLAFPGKSKSMALPSGRLGLRAQQPKLEILDMDAALSFVRKANRGKKPANIPIKVVETVSVTDLKRYWESTGLVPDGCAVEADRPDKPYVEG
jgi:hypothetical protein